MSLIFPNSIKANLGKLEPCKYFPLNTYSMASFGMLIEINSFFVDLHSSITQHYSQELSLCLVVSVKLSQTLKLNSFSKSWWRFVLLQQFILFASIWDVILLQTSRFSIIECCPNLFPYVIYTSTRKFPINSAGCEISIHVAEVWKTR